MTRSLRVLGGTDVHGGRRDVLVHDGLLAAATSGGAPVLDATGLTVAPGLIDLQLNGAGGIDVTDEPERLREIGPVLARYGVTAYLPTVITSSPGARETALATFTGTNDWAGAVPLGVHFEGPMIAPARKGAHPGAWLTEPSLDLVASWSREAGVLMATLAPELPGALDVIAALTARGVVVSVGHTEASADQVAAAEAAGARCVTHLFNAMPPLVGREPGPVGRALAGHLVAGVIADGHHLAPDTLRTAWRALGPDRFLAVSDTTAALGVPDGPARLGDQSVVVAGGAVRLEDGTLAGSAAALSDCLRTLRATTGCSLADTIAAATTTPAALIGDPTRGRLDPGYRGDLVLLDTADGRFDVVATVLGGTVVHDTRES
ncbi:N-acetylglucosamine-6-phosphate deacetylase [Marmoricola sp. RAF53]|uniref:N-acetylglucosamine-6-phosphate deacetylase n=1 Tax=Marmoricola sp. RAF53 TaxID=3233059 RepID=UPI003F9CEE48